MGFDFNNQIDCKHVQYYETIDEIVNLLQKKFDEDNYGGNNNIVLTNTFNLSHSTQFENTISIQLKDASHVALPILFELWYLNYMYIFPWVSFDITIKDKSDTYGNLPVNLIPIIPLYFERECPYYTVPTHGIYAGVLTFNIPYILAYMEFVNHIGHGDTMNCLTIGKRDTPVVRIALDDVFKFITYILMHKNNFSNFRVSSFILQVFGFIDNDYPLMYTKHELYHELETITSLVDYCEFFYKHMFLPYVIKEFPLIYKEHAIKVDGMKNDLPVFDCWIL